MKLGDATILLGMMIGALIWIVETAPQNAPAIAVEFTAPKSEHLPPFAAFKCSFETWPNITADCLRSANAVGALENARLVIADRP